MKTISYLLLGDGDFTYSLDLCRYIASLSHQTSNATDETVVYSITCTGVDTLEELRCKYKDADFVLKNIRQCSNHDDASGEIQVQANDCKNNGDDAQQQQQSSPLRHFDHVMFHHPHLGKEDAQLHSRFLHHLFYAADKRWLKHKNNVSCDTRNSNNETSSGGLLYLTLVNGQCARWKCIEAAKKHGFVLLRRSPFNPPPAVTSNSATYYQLRRHQSGKSFAKRRRMQQESHEKKQAYGLSDNDSETLVFGRVCEYERVVSDCKDDTLNEEQRRRIGLLPWESNNTPLISPINQTSRPSNNSLFSCLYCAKPFLEERSLKNHMINTHPDCKEVASWAAKKSKKNKKNKVRVGYDEEGASRANSEESSLQHEVSTKVNTTVAPLICSMCEDVRLKDPLVNETARTFPHVQALLDHQRAKHFGSHSDIKPDWCNSCDSEAQTDRYGNTEGSQSNSDLGSCSICGISYSSEAEKLQHELEFVPYPLLRSTSGDGPNHAAIDSFKCKYCSKPFKGVRAQQQHENFCLTRDTHCQ
eukprot:scaffold14046_cov76-Cyclotella_meneghiniana.AAC.5